MFATNLVVKPRKENVIGLVYTALTDWHHGDPGQMDKSNFSLYRRSFIRIKMNVSGRAINKNEIDRITEMFKVPSDISSYFEDEPLTRFVAILLTKIFIEEYGGGQGTGIFEGEGRYERLRSRFVQSSKRTNNLKEFWSLVSQELKVPPIVDTEVLSNLMILLSLPSSFGAFVLDQITKNMPLIIVIARMWVEKQKNNSPKYWLAINKEKVNSILSPLDDISTNNGIIAVAKKLGHSFEDQSTFVKLSYPQEVSNIEGRERYVSVPVITHSPNDIRHDLREALWYHLLEHIADEKPDKTLLGDDLTVSNTSMGAFWGTLPEPIQRLLENAGAMSGTAPSDAYALVQLIRATYPLWGLLGGSTNTFMLGEGNLKSVSTYLFGFENNDALAEFGISVSESVNDLLDETTLTRHGVRSKSSPMPTSFETIQKGAKMLVRLQLSQFATDLEIGALAAAIKTFQELNGTIGGKAARGFGRVSIEAIQFPEKMEHCLKLYEEYLITNKDKLRKGLLDGTLCTGKPICA